MRIVVICGLAHLESFSSKPESPLGLIVAISYKCRNPQFAVTGQCAH
jgi:hypothetical protein